VSAFITLFTSILQTPTDSRARSDLRLMRSLVDVLAKLQHEDSHELKRIFRVCSEFERAARDVVERAEKNTKHWKTGKWSNKDLNAEKAQFTNPHAVPLTPLSATVNNGLGYTSPSLYGRTTNHVSGLVSDCLADIELTRLQNFTSALDDSLGTCQFPQHLPDLMSEIQPMFPNGLTMPWNGDTFHGLFAPESFPTNSYGFEVSMSR
jgi:hypothetical protein